MSYDFAYAYWVDDKIGLRRLVGVDIGFMNLVDGLPNSGVVSLDTARSLAKQLMTVIDMQSKEE